MVAGGLVKKRTLPEMNYLAELVGEFIEYWGFKNIHGKIWVNLYLSETPLDAAALIEKLQVSKALISISLKELMDYNVIFEVGLSDNGTRLYTANSDLHEVISQVLRQREKIMMGKIKAAFDQLKKMPVQELMASGIRNEKVKELDRFMKKGEKALDTLMAIL